MKSKRNIFLWVLYDFGNSIISIVFFLYFAQWVVVEQGIKDIYFNSMFTVAAVLLLLTVPITGFFLDKYWRHITGLRISTIGAVILYAASALSAVFVHPVAALTFFTLALYSYLLSFTFYTPLINDIVEPEKRGRISGFGTAANYTGQFAGLLLVLPFSNGMFSLFQSSPRAETLLPATIIFAIFTLPTILFFVEPLRPKVAIEWKKDIKSLLSQTKSLFLVPGLGFFMLSYFFFNDAVLTAANNFPIFLEQVWGVSDLTKTLILVGILVTSAIGGLIGGELADRFGHKKTLVWIVAGWVVILPLIGLVTNFKIFVILTTFMGLWFGSNWAVSRSVMAYLVPQGGYNLSFAYYGLVERASAFVGPIVWGLVVSHENLGNYRYRLATIAITLFIVLGLLFLLKVKSDRAVSLQSVS